MLDSAMRRLIDPPLNAAAAAIGTKISANQITIGGFLLGLVCCYAVVQGMFVAALIFLLLNRLADGLDGAVARQTAPSALGAYIDIVSDFLLWGAAAIGVFVLRYGKCICGRHFVVELCHVDDGVSRLRHSGRKAWADQRGARQKRHILPRRFPRARRPLLFSPSPYSTPPPLPLPRCCLRLLSIFRLSGGLWFPSIIASKIGR